MKKVLHFFVYLAFLTSCSYSPSTIEDATLDIEVLQKFHAWFPDSKCKIKRYGGIGAPNAWKSRAILHERYELCCYFEIENHSIFNNKIRKTKSAYLYLNEVIEGIKLDEKGSLLHLSRKSMGTITEEDFLGMNSIDEMFAKMNVVLRENEPVDNIDFLNSYW